MSSTLSFSETLSKLRTLVGQDVDVEIWGRLDDDSCPVIELAGKLDQVTVTAPGDEIDEDEAVIFSIGEGSRGRLNLWPRRFAGAELYEREGVSIETLDGGVTIALQSRPWID